MVEQSIGLLAVGSVLLVENVGLERSNNCNKDKHKNKNNLLHPGEHCTSGWSNNFATSTVHNRSTGTRAPSFVVRDSRGIRSKTIKDPKST